MRDWLRILVLGACNLNDTFYSLEQSSERWPRIRMVSRDVWSGHTPVVHSLHDALQFVRLCSGELDTPSWVASYIYESPPPPDLAARGKGIYDADVVLFEYSTPVEIAFRDLHLNRNAVFGRIRDPLLAAMPELRGAFAEWFTEGLLKQNGELADRGAKQLLAAIPENMPRAAEWRAIISEARGFALGEQKVEEGIAALRARFDCPFGVVMPSLQYTANGRGWGWPPEFSGQLEDVCIKLKLPMFDIGDVVRDHGANAVLQNDLYHVRTDFSGLLDATFLFATKLVDSKILARMRFFSDFCVQASELNKKALLHALAWTAADTKHHENVGTYYQTRFSRGQFFPDYDVSVAFYCLEHFGADDLLVEFGTGFGELSLLLAIGGLNTLGIESDATRYAGAVAVLEALRREGDKLENLELRHGVYPEACKSIVRRAGSRRVLASSHVAGTYVVDELDEVLDSFVRFDDLVIDVGIFGKRRDETEVDELVRKIEGKGFEVISPVLPSEPHQSSEPHQYRHFRRIPVPQRRALFGHLRPWILSRPVLRGLGFVLGLGLIVAWASLSLRIHTRPDTIHNMSHILHGQPLEFGGDLSAIHPFYNRVLFPTLLTALSHELHVLSESQWYILLRIATVIMGLGAFALTCVRTLHVTPRDFRFATALMAVSMIATFGYPWEDPTDVLDVCAQALSVLAALEGRFILCLALAAFFACNRESAAYAGIVWFVLAPGPRSWPRRGAEAVAISVASYAVAMAIRLSVSSTGSVNWLPLPHNFEALELAVGHFTFVNWLADLFAVTLFLLCSLDLKESLVRRFVLLAGIFALPAVLFGYVDDLRVFLPCAVMLCFAVAASPGIDKEA